MPMLRLLLNPFPSTPDDLDDPHPELVPDQDLEEAEAAPRLRVIEKSKRPLPRSVCTTLKDLCEL